MNETSKPKCWIDPKTKAPMFRADISVEEARELERILRQAFNAGLASGWRQAQEARPM